MSLLGTKVLIVVTSHATLGTTGKATGYYLPEVSHPYAVLTENGFKVDIASPQGGNAPVDRGSLHLNDPVNKEFWENKATRAQLENTLPLEKIDTKNYRAIIFAGGHGTMWDFADNRTIQRLTASIYEQGGIVAAVCHGPAALINVRLGNGDFLVSGKQLTAFSNAEEDAAQLTEIMPFLLERKLRERGARYTEAPLWQQNVIADDRLVTGQNPASAAGVGQKVADLLSPKHK